MREELRERVRNREILRSKEKERGKRGGEDGERRGEKGQKDEDQNVIEEGKKRKRGKKK